MKASSIKNFFVNNIGLKLLSVLLAIILWLVVLNISDYVVTVEIKDIPVEQLNGDVLEELDQIYEVESGDTVDILVKGRRSIVADLKADSFKATADLSTMSITNTVQIFVEAKNKKLQDEVTITCVDNTLSLSLEDKVSTQFPIKIVVNGTPGEGYAVGSSYANPNIVTVEGPKNTVGKITEIVAEVGVSGRQDSFETSTVLAIRDAYGDQVKSDKITINYEEAMIGVSIYPVKEVPVVVSVADEPKDGYGVSEVIYQPQSVKIAAESGTLAGVTEIVIDDISVAGLKEDLQTTVNVSNYLPERVTLAPGSDENIVINAIIQKHEEKTLKPTANQIEFENQKEGYTYSVKIPANFSITVSGLSDVVQATTMNNVRLYVDCDKLIVGENTYVKLSSETEDGIECEVIGYVTVNVEKDK